MARVSNDAIRKYHALVRELFSLGEIEINANGKIIKLNLKEFSTIESARYALKLLDVELPTTHLITEENRNKCHFDVAPPEFIYHHISWLEEVLNDNITAKMVQQN